MSRRTQRVGELLQAELSQLLLRSLQDRCARGDFNFASVDGQFGHKEQSAVSLQQSGSVGGTAAAD